jgi:3-isopropylmalate/(R)-2-methylmalate dehydratase small subunit
MRIEGYCSLADKITFDQKEYGDIVVGGKFFASHVKSIHISERLVNHLKSSGCRLILADSYGRSFYRNCINLGLPALECPGITAEINNGDFLEVDLEAGLIKNVSTGNELRSKGLPKPLLDILVEGGIVNYTKESVTT